MPKWRLFAVVFATTFSLGLIAFTTYGHVTGVDLRILWKASRLPVSEIYRPDPFGPFVYPPTAIAWLKPLAVFPFWTAFGLWTAVSVLCFWRAANSALVFVSPAVVQCLVAGQTSLILASLLLVWSQGLAMGVMFGLVCSIKPQIAFLAPIVFVVRRDFDALLGFGLAVLTAVLITTGWLGLGIWRDWIEAMPAFRDVIVNRNLFWVFISPGGMAGSLGLPFIPAWLLGVAVALLAVLYSRPSDDRILIVGSSLLAAPYAAGQDMAALIPFALAAATRPIPALTFAGLPPSVLLPFWLLSSTNRALHLGHDRAGFNGPAECQSSDSASKPQSA